MKQINIHKCLVYKYYLIDKEKVSNKINYKHNKNSSNNKNNSKQNLMN